MSFEDTDAWILSAIALAARPGSLTQVIWAADALNVALPTMDELNGALFRLGQAGLVRRDGDVLEVPGSVRHFQERWEHEPVRRLVKHFADFLQAPPAEQSSDFRPFTQAEVATATEQYSREFRKKVRELRGDEGE